MDIRYFPLIPTFFIIVIAFMYFWWIVGWCYDIPRYFKRRIWKKNPDYFLHQKMRDQYNASRENQDKATFKFKIGVNCPDCGCDEFYFMYHEEPNSAYWYDWNKFVCRRCGLEYKYHWVYDAYYALNKYDFSPEAWILDRIRKSYKSSNL